MSAAWLGVSLLLTGAAPQGDKLAVYDRGEWRTWWQADAARTEWAAADATLTRALKWQRVQPGLESAELRIAARAPALRMRLILIRIDTRQFDWKLVEQHNNEGGPAWEADAVSRDVALAFNAGQFSRGRSWGWVVNDGTETHAPGYGPLSMALVIDSARQASLVSFTDIEATRGRDDVRVAFQSYPVLLEDGGSVPVQLRADDRGVDLKHRDSRLAIGQMRDGRILIALTRFDIGGGLLRPVPIGPNTPEMAAIMGALGCNKAMMLDGGISSQVLLRADDGDTQVWPAYRWVPLGLVASPVKVKN